MIPTQPSSSIYVQLGDGLFYSPFNLTAERMERLILVNWNEGEAYAGAEVQVFDDEEHGRGLLTILARPDGKVDVYFEPSLTLDRPGYAVGGGLGEWVPTAFERARFEVGPAGADLDVAFDDIAGRRIALRVYEGGGKPPAFFSMLAPLGAGVKEPLRFPLFLLYDFAFVRRRGTEIDLSIDGEPLKPAGLPLPVAGSWVYFTRYSRDPFIASWNRAFTGELAPSRPGRFTLHGVDYELVEREGHFEIAAMSVDNGKHVASVTFTPPVPDVVGLREGASVSGAFVARGEQAAGRVEGVYEVARQGNQVNLRLHPSGGWLPNERRLSVRLVYALVSLFKRWPKTYEWNATVTRDEGGRVSLRSGWRRLA